MRFTLFFLAFVGLMMPQTATSEILSATDKIVEKFMELDFDESEGVSWDEYKLMVMGRMGDRFNLMDADGDGEISEEEYRTFWTETKSQYYRPRRE
ncbi:MAG TPA: thymidylate synthase [Ghiorsea sp.]|nr:thymidylate synthase [Ghiorsea sp.]HIP06409.1 thymidylate synthase [Mariprofundaceae bacterium]